MTDQTTATTEAKAQQPNESAAGAGFSAVTGSDAFLTDCNDREICVGDVVKVEHYKTKTGRGYRQHYMYKWVLGIVQLGTKPSPFLKIGHLTPKCIEKMEHYYEQLDGRKLDHYEIVQGFTGDTWGQDFRAFDQRPRRHQNMD